MNKIKQFLMRRRCRKLLNQKGFSLIEIMVALGLITLLTALAVPQYTSYKKNVKVGVVESILLVPPRTMAIEESLGNNPHSVDQDRMLRTIKSPAVGKFGNTSKWKTQNNSKDWCFELSSGSSPYDGFTGCVDNAGVPKVGGADISCSKAKAYKEDTGDPGTKTCNNTVTCTDYGSACKLPQGVPIPDCVTDGKGTEVTCEGGTYTKSASCNGTRKCVLN